MLFVLQIGNVGGITEVMLQRFIVKVMVRSGFIVGQ
jgi:hypothetical protein